MSNSSSGVPGNRPRGDVVSHGSGRLPVGSGQPTVVPIRFQAESRSASGEVAERSGKRSSATLVVAGALLAVAASVVAIRVVQMQKTRLPANGSGLPTAYAMACKACQARFEMPVDEYRELLQTRSNKNFSRVRCPKCGGDDAAYRTDSGMEGLGELGPDGVPVANPRQPARQTGEKRQ